MWMASGAAARNAERTSSRRGKTELESALVRIQTDLLSWIAGHPFVVSTAPRPVL
jgi:hypothetical protein